MRFGLLASLLAFFLTLSVAGTAFAGPGLGDTDGDGLDDFFDNCTAISNTGQTDSDFDGCGNICDGDFNQDGVSNGQDFLLFKGAFIAGASGVTDMNSDHITNGADFLLLKTQLTQGVPGPSSNTFKDPLLCPLP